MKLEFARAAAIAALWSLVAASTATAHITLETAEAPADSYYKAAFRVPHGCEGTPTVAIRIRIPDGVTNVKPQQKAGWLEALRSPSRPLDRVAIQSLPQPPSRAQMATGL